MKRKSRKEKIQDMQVQWVFLLFGTLLAVLGGLTVNALYDLLRDRSPVWAILAFSGSLFLFFLYVFSFLFENLEEVTDAPEGEEMKFFRKYHLQRFSAFCRQIKERLSK